MLAVGRIGIYSSWPAPAQLYGLCATWILWFTFHWALLIQLCNLPPRFKEFKLLIFGKVKKKVINIWDKSAHIYFLKATASVVQSFLFILHGKLTLFILHIHFYKTLTSVSLFYHLFYLNNYFSHFIYYFPPVPPPYQTLQNITDILYLFIFHLLLVSCFFFFSFPSPSYIFGIFIFLFSFSFFFLFFFYLSLIMDNDFGFAILMVILGRFFHYMDCDFGALHWLLLLLLQHLVLLADPLADPSTDLLSLSLLVCLCVGVFGFMVSVVDFVVDFWLCMWGCVYQRKKKMMRVLVL